MVTTLRWPSNQSKLIFLAKVFLQQKIVYPTWGIIWGFLHPGFQSPPWWPLSHFYRLRNPVRKKINLHFPMLGILGVIIYIYICVYIASLRYSREGLVRDSLLKIYNNPGGELFQGHTAFGRSVISLLVSYKVARRKRGAPDPLEFHPPPPNRKPIKSFPFGSTRSLKLR